MPFYTGDKPDPELTKKLRAQQRAGFFRTWETPKTQARRERQIKLSKFRQSAQHALEATQPAIREWRMRRLRNTLAEREEEKQLGESLRRNREITTYQFRDLISGRRRRQEEEKLQQATDLAEAKERFREVEATQQPPSRFNIKKISRAMEGQDLGVWEPIQPDFPAQRREIPINPEAVKRDPEGAAFAQGMGLTYLEYKDMTLERANEMLRSGKLDLGQTISFGGWVRNVEEADRQFQDLLKKNRKEWESNTEAKEIQRYVFENWGVALGIWDIGEGRFKNRKDVDKIIEPTGRRDFSSSSERALFRTLNAVDPYLFPDIESRQAFIKGVTDMAHAEAGIDVLGTKITETTLWWGAVFPTITAGMLVGEITGGVLGEEIAGEKGRLYGGLIGGLGLGVFSPAILNKTRRLGTRWSAVPASGMVNSPNPNIVRRVLKDIAQGFKTEVEGGPVVRKAAEAKLKEMSARTGKSVEEIAGTLHRSGEWRTFLQEGLETEAIAASQTIVEDVTAAKNFARQEALDAITVLGTKGRPLSVIRAEKAAKAKTLAARVRGAEQSFNAYVRLETATEKLLRIQSEIAARSLAGRGMRGPLRTLASAEKTVTRAEETLKKAEVAAKKYFVAPESVRYTQALRELKTAINNPARWQGFIEQLPDESRVWAHMLENTPRGSMEAFQAASEVAHTGTKLGWALKAPKPIRGLARWILGHDIYIDDLEKLGKIMGAGWGRERFVTELTASGFRAWRYTTQQLWRSVGLRGKEVSLYTGPAREGFPHSIASIIQRPDLYKLTTQQEAVVNIIRQSINENLALTERMLGVDTKLLADVFSRQAMEVEGFDLVGSALIKEGGFGYWPQYLERGAFADITGQQLANIPRGSIGLKQAFEKVRKHKDIFELWDEVLVRAEITPKLMKPWDSMARRFTASGQAIGDAQYARAITTGIPHANKQTIRFGSSGIPGLAGKYFEADVAAALREQTKIMSGRIPMRPVRVVANILRSMKLSWDLSGGLAIQGFFFLTNAITRPAYMAKHGINASRMFFQPSYFNKWYATNLPKILRMQSRGLNIATNPVDIMRITRGEFLQAVKKPWQLPFKVADILNDANFGRLVTYYKFTTAEQWLDIFRYSRLSPEFASFAERIPGIRKLLGKVKGVEKLSDEAIEKMVYEAINNRFGGISKVLTGKGGMRTAFEQLFDIAPNWLRARTSVYINALKGRGPERYMALSMLGRELATGAAISTGLSYLITDELPNLTDPTKFDWLAVKTPWGSIPTIPSVSVMRLIVREGANMFDFGKALLGDDPEGMMAAKTNMWNAFKRAIRGRESPAVAAIIEQAEGKDFLGNPVETWDERIRRAILAGLPIFAEDISDAIERDAPPEELAVAGALGFSGANLIPRRLRDILYEKFEDISYSDSLGTKQKGESYDSDNPFHQHVMENVPELKELRDKVREEAATYFGESEATKVSEKVKEAEDEQLGDLADQILAGNPTAAQNWGYQRSRTQSFLAGIRSTDETDWGEPESELGQLIDAYYDIVPEMFTTLAGEYDDARYDAAKEDKLNEIKRLDSRAAAAIEKRPKFKSPKIEEVDTRWRAYQDDKDKLDTLPKYKFVTKEQEPMVDRLLDLAKKVSDLSALSGNKISRPELLRRIVEAVRQDPEGAKKFGLDIKIVFTAWILTKSSLRDIALSNARDEFILDNPDMAFFSIGIWKNLSREEQLEWITRYPGRIPPGPIKEAYED